jgi:hypothetical protein
MATPCFCDFFHGQLIEKEPQMMSRPHLTIGVLNIKLAGKTGRMRWNTYMVCNDHFYVCRESEQPHTLMVLLHADPTSYNK